VTRARRLTLSLVAIAACGAGVATAAVLLTAPRAASDPVLIVVPNTPAFSIAPMIPGTSVTRCLVVGNGGGSAMKLVDYPVLTGALSDYLNVTIERGTGVTGEAPSCTKFVPAATDSFAYGTHAGGVAVSALTDEKDDSFVPGEAKSLRVTLALPSSAPTAAAAKQATFAFTFLGAGVPTTTTTPTTTTPDLPGGIAPGTTGGFDKNGNFLTNSQIKKRLRIGKARLLKNGDIVVKMFLPAGGAIRAKAIMTNGVYYAHTLLPVEWGPTVRVLLKRRPVGRDAVAKHRREHRGFALRITTRYRWAHGPNAFVQPEQKLTVLRGR
jgi:hypothetical protein